MPVPLRDLRNVDAAAQRGARMLPSKTPQRHVGGGGSGGGKENRTPAACAAHTPGSAAGAMRRRMLKDDLVELLSTARLADLQAELKAISPAEGSAQRSARATPAASGGAPRHAPARSTGTHADIRAHSVGARHGQPASGRSPDAASPLPARAEAAVVPSDLFHCTPDSGAGSSSAQQRIGCGGGEAHAAPTAAAPGGSPTPPPADGAQAGAGPEDVSPLTMGQIEINRKREALFRRPLAAHGGGISKGARRSRGSSVVTVLGCAVGSRPGSRANSRPNSRPGSRRESLADDEQRRRAQEELDTGDSAGAQKYRQLRLALQGRSPMPETSVTPPSPACLWTRLIPAQDQPQVVEISLAPQSLATPALAMMAPAQSPAESTAVPIQPHCAHQDGRSVEGTEPASPLSHFIAMFQTASRREVGKHILRVWKKRSAAERRLSAASTASRLSLSSAGSCSPTLESPTCAADQDDLEASGALFNIQFSTRQQADGPGPPSVRAQDGQQQQHRLWADALGQAILWVHTLLLRGAFRQWRTATRARALEQLALQRFRCRHLRRFLYTSFHRWGFVCQ